MSDELERCFGLEPCGDFGSSGGLLLGQSDECEVRLGDRLPTPLFWIYCECGQVVGPSSPSFADAEQSWDEMQRGMANPSMEAE